MNMDTLNLTFVTPLHCIVSLELSIYWTIAAVKACLQMQLAPLQAQSFCLISDGKTLLDNETVSVCQLKPFNYIFIAINDVTSASRAGPSCNIYSQSQTSLRELAYCPLPPITPFDKPVLQVQRGEFQLLIASLVTVFGVKAESSLVSYIFDEARDKIRADSSKPAIEGQTAQFAQMQVSKLEQYMRPPGTPGSDVSFPEVATLSIPVRSVLNGLSEEEAICQLLMNPYLIPLKLESLRLMGSIPTPILSMIVQMKEQAYRPLFRALRTVSATYGIMYPVDPNSIDGAIARWNIILEPLNDPVALASRNTAVDYGILNPQGNIALCRLMKFGSRFGFSQEQILTRWVQNNLGEMETLFGMLDSLLGASARSAVNNNISG